MGEWKFVFGVWVTWPRWPPCPYMVKNTSKIFFSRTKGPMTLWHWGLGPIIICSNDNPSWPWPILWQGQIWSHAFIWGKLLESHLMEETYSKWPEWQKVYVYIKILIPRGCLPLPRGQYTCIKTWKIMYKIRLQRYFFETCNKWARWEGFSVDIRILSTKGFLFTFLSAPPPGLHTCGKTIKNLYKIRIQRDLFETCNKWSKW